VTRSASGTYTEYILASDETGLKFTPTNAARLSITDVSVRLYTMPDPLFAKSSSGAVVIEGYCI